MARGRNPSPTGSQTLYDRDIRFCGIHVLDPYVKGHSVFNVLIAYGTVDGSRYGL